MAVLAGCGGGGPAPVPGGGERATVVRVTDGDTIRVRLASGAQERVRYIGIDTPEVGGREECFGREARAANRRLLGLRVRLERDEEERDRYGRLLAYVHSRGEMVNAALVRDGFAEPLTVAPNDRHERRLRALAREARAAGRGLWAACRQ